MTEQNPIRFLEVEEVVELNRVQIAIFGGSHQVRDPNGLDAAVMMPRQTFGGQDLHPTIESKASAYLFHIAMNHPFLDGNKRTALHAADTFLGVNGYELVYSPQHYDVVMNIVNGKMSKEELSDYISKHIARLGGP